MRKRATQKNIVMSISLNKTPPLLTIEYKCHTGQGQVFLRENQQTVVHGAFPDFCRNILGPHKNSSLHCLQNALIAIELGQKILFIRKTMTQFYVHGSIARELR